MPRFSASAWTSSKARSPSEGDKAVGSAGSGPNANAAAAFTTIERQTTRERKNGRACFMWRFLLGLYGSKIEINGCAEHHGVGNRASAAGDGGKQAGHLSRIRGHIANQFVLDGVDAKVDDRSSRGDHFAGD